MKILGLILIFWLSSLQANENTAWVLKIKGAIAPATADYFKRSLEDAQDENVKLIVLEINTPGGIDTALRAIAKMIRLSPIPIIIYIAPPGAKALGATNSILAASHIKAMAPGTTLNNLSAQEALANKKIDLIALNVAELLQNINARTVTILGKEQLLISNNMQIEIHEPGWFHRLLIVISNPNIAYILMLIAIYGLFFELYNPGSILPGAIGAIALLLTLFAFQILPINYGGIALILLGIAFMVAEAFIPTFGVLGIAGVIAFIFGSIMLIDTESPDYAISLPLIGGLSLMSLVFFLWIINTIMKIRNKPVMTGKEEMIGLQGECITNKNGQLRIEIHGETWNAQSKNDDIKPGQCVKVIQIDGLTLTVDTIGD